MAVFRHVDERDPSAVTLQLNASGNFSVTGPSNGLGSFSTAYGDLDSAFAAAIRLANQEDAELVVSGPQEMWPSARGDLDSRPRSTAWDANRCDSATPASDMPA